MCRKTQPRSHGYRIVAWVIFALLVGHGWSTFSAAAADSRTDDKKIQGYNDQIEKRKNEIEKIKRRLEIYQQRISETRQEANSLRGQIGLIENDIAKRELDIELTRQQIATTNLEIQKTAREIIEQNARIESQRERLRHLLQLIYRDDQVSYLEIMLTNDTLSEFFDYRQRLQDVQAQLQQALGKLKGLQAALELQQGTLTTKQTEEVKFKGVLEEQRQDLAEQATHQTALLRDTERSEKKYAAYVQELKLEQQQVNQDIVGIEKRIREELERKKKESDRLAALGRPGLIWPTDGRYVTAYFHDPEYPYRNIFEHPAVDVRTPQGSAVYAAEAGYVAKVKDGGAKGYSYVMLIHNDGLSTVYGHVSRIDVREGQFVTKGAVIAGSGGTPGTRGAGRLTTGAHIHFEVRVNGIPKNPLNYLP